MTVNYPVCYLCKHKNDGEFTCAAFPDGIPEAIVLEGNPHLKPFSGQANDDIFEPRNDEARKIFESEKAARGIK